MVVEKPVNRGVSEEARSRVEGMEKSVLPCVCGEFEGTVMATQDRYGFDARVVLCGCGIIRIDPYYADVSEFYSSGLYHEIYRGGEHGKREEIDLHDGKVIREWIEKKTGLEKYSVVDVGGGSGAKASAFPGVLVLDVDEGSVKEAKRRGLLAKVGESTNGVFDVVLAIHTLEHMRDPVGYVRDVLGPMVGKYLYVETPGLWSVATDYGLDARGLFQNAHPWYFTLETLRYVMALAGFGLVVGTQGVMSLWEKREVDADEFYSPVLGESVNAMLGSFLHTKYCVAGINDDTIGTQ